ncbi:hypothetical protein CWB96_03740 [Pseudoalteromonas citrea]|uniref:Uncharacterized protein n=1 Tax=Pseudoalteromonas citrea TaxID=43655 RepID=A0A5S3XTS1_9GAMM|nr:hypothetical protein BGP78_14270 [Pseudoalteromonas sp. MSK9-3]TMP45210.1 hypothetical protein CWB97_05270 [Pseudoalteromonas citrea]TMP61409.1 hypothetical protein CWB96_03740 [Pseudoalteromonas citrea]
MLKHRFKTDSKAIILSTNGFIAHFPASLKRNITLMQRASIVYFQVNDFLKSSAHRVATHLLCKCSLEAI